MSLLSQGDELVQHVTHQVRATVRVNPGRPALALGIRTALATVVPLALAPLLGDTVSQWASTAGFVVAIADKGGSYRTRAGVLGWNTVASMVAVFVGGIGANYPWGAPFIMLTCVFCCAAIGVMGPIATSAGSNAAVMLCIALGLPGIDLAASAERGAAVLGGGAWAMAIALFFWPVRLYRPARYAVANSYRKLAEYVRLVHEPTQTLGTPGWIEAVSRAHGPIRQSIEEARVVLAATRRGRRAESGRGALLLVLLQTLELLFGAVVALEDVLEIAAREASKAHLRRAVDAALRRIEACLEELAGRVITEGRLGEPAIDWTLVGSEMLGADATAFADQVHRAHIAAVMMRLRDGIANAYDTTDRLYDAQLVASVQAPVALGTETVQAPLWKRFIEELRTHPLTLRHAARVSLMTMAAVIVAERLHLTRGYWVTLNVVVLLQPYTVQTAVKTFQRIGGTALGSILAALVMAAVPDERGLFAIAALLSGLCASVLQLNYGLYAFFSAPTFVLLAEVHARDIHLPEIRIVNTMIGGVLALIGSRLFWPQRESELFPDAIADAFAALRGHFDAAIRVLIDPSAERQTSFNEARRAFGLAVNLAEASFQRRLAEVGSLSARELEPAMTLLLYGRRFSATCSALAAVRVIEAKVPAEELERFCGEVDAVLSGFEATARRGMGVGPATVVAPVDGLSPALAVRVSRVPLQLDILREAMTRWEPTRS